MKAIDPKTQAAFDEVQSLAKEAMGAIIKAKPSRAAFGLLLAGVWVARAIGWDRKLTVTITGKLFDTADSSQRRQELDLN